jgi:hypothetical protein
MVDPSFSITSRISSSLRVYSPSRGDISLIAFTGSRPCARTCDVKAYCNLKRNELIQDGALEKSKLTPYLIRGESHSFAKNLVTIRSGFVERAHHEV